MSSKKRILVIDDQKELFDILSKFLNKKNFDVVYQRAEHALDYIKQTDYIDLALMDIMMPNINGYDLTKQIREMAIDYYLPIIMLTAKSELDDLVKGLDTGADDYITKPFEFNELLARINSCLRRSEKQQIFSGPVTSTSLDLRAIKLNFDEKQKELERQIFYLKNLIEMSFELNSVMDIQKLVNIALFALISHLGSKNAAILMEMDPIDSRIIPLNSKGILDEVLQELNLSRNTNIYKHFEFKEDPEHVSELVKLAHLKNELEPFLKAEIELIAPIRNNSHLEGFVILGSRLRNREYKMEELSVIRMFNSMLAISMSNAMMYEKIKELSYTDGMTGLHNYRYFELRLAEEIARAARNTLKVSFLIIDVDFFKNYNDTLGHQAGDEALRIMGRIMKNSVRNVDIPVRYGGEEFGIILPNVDKEGAAIFAGRLRKRVEETRFPKEEVQPGGALTCSIGVSTFPDDATDMEDLIYKADLSLYKAKKDGRNRYILFDPALLSQPISHG